MNKWLFLMSSVIILVCTFGLMIAASSPAGLIDDHRTLRVGVLATPNTDLIELLFNEQPEITIFNGGSTSTSWFCFPRDVPQALVSGGSKIVVKLSGNGVSDEQAFYNWEARVGLPSGQGGVIGGATGGLLGTYFGGPITGLVGVLGGFGVGAALEERSFSGIAIFPCLAKGSYLVTVEVYDDNGNYWFSKTKNINV